MRNAERFLAATKINMTKIDDLHNTEVKLGKTMTAEFPESGYVKDLLLFVKGTMTLTDGSGNNTLKLKGIHDNNPVAAMIRELRIKLNNGQVVHRVRGRDLRTFNLVQQRSQFPDLLPASVPGAVTGARSYKFSTDATAGGKANDVAFGVKVPFALNEIDPLGILPLQGGVNVTVEIDWARADDMFDMADTDAVAWDGSIYNLLETYTVPVQNEDRPVITHVHQLVSDSKPINTKGEQKLKYESGPTYLRLFHRLIVNGARGGLGDISTLALSYNGNVYPIMPTDYDIWMLRQRLMYGRDLPQAEHVLDFMYNGTPNYASSRDWMPTKDIKKFQQEFMLASSVVLGGNNNEMEFMSQFLSEIKFD